MNGHVAKKLKEIRMDAPDVGSREYYKQRVAIADVIIEAQHDTLQKVSDNLGVPTPETPTPVAIASDTAYGALDLRRQWTGDGVWRR